ncbi:hypothetical protein SERLA73DRAFT_110899 [Serpula lacrymans var. lacrymans S7.3]|uniref:FAD-binding PCMH-type domain-containing protein n=2 Tax=Serpula lacrymans var. lacrymans TaxID=341189 RepID=F8Q345_SERL3|nr:uncharacterized protein SERLADRAFT_472047 [Serpula lacrymans var. lacrymans S7.9]EGN97606.1 hypothetical protein SERLA73DRAFT_110899 [Serpula lacrymans var. lacrymans S7.3]EGO23200.1 hypothetical protein SERLADRAFT_472047 [Serpula lacrymans var. lacrymans S7.9]
MRVFNVLAPLGLGALACASSSSDCRCIYGETCWPNTTQFDQLQGQISQPLLHPLPPASPCYPPSDPSGNCTAVNQGWGDGNWRSSQDGAMQSTNWETFTFKNGTIDACYLNTTITKICEQGSVPVVGVDAREPSDIQAAVNFAVEHNLRLVVKNTGHDYLGRSTARGSFMIWTHNMKNITYNSSFVPEGAPATESYEAITLGAGVQWHEAYDAIQAQGRVMVGGASAGGSVGAAGGWVLGGGHSSLAPSFGLGADNVVEMGVVLSTGEYVVANSYQRPDLFWALRGGGGGTYGVVTHVTYHTYPSFPVAAVFFEANTTNTDVMQTVFTEFTRIHPAISDAGWSGYALISSEAMGFFYIAPNTSVAQANATFDPFFTFAQNLTSQGLIVSNYTVPFDSWYSWYTTLFNTTGQVGGNSQISSRLLPRESFENNYEQLAKTLFALPGGYSWNFVAGGEVSRIDPDSVAVNPAWRDALVEVAYGESWDEGATSGEIDALISQLKQSMAAVSAITPNSGAYYNEASLYEVDFQYTFFGEHYPSLLAIKDKYDPHRLFVVAKGVGSEEWDSELRCRS